MSPTRFVAEHIAPVTECEERLFFVKNRRGSNYGQVGMNLSEHGFQVRKDSRRMKGVLHLLKTLPVRVRNGG